MDARNFTYMFYGFAAVWLCLVVYVVSLADVMPTFAGSLRD